MKVELPLARTVGRQPSWGSGIPLVIVVELQEETAAAGWSKVTVAAGWGKVLE